MEVEEKERFNDFPTGAEIKKGGGTRRFFRAPYEGVPAIFCFYDDEKEENRYYAGIAVFLKKLGVPVPKILRNAPEEKLIVMEDLGATDLWTLSNDNAQACSRAYRSALEGLALLHKRGHALLDAGTPIMRDGFNRAYYSWERNYFLTNALDEGLKISLDSEARSALEIELVELAGTLLALPQQLVHRDCQSQNILWKNEASYFIDFQGLRVGTGWYDVASLLFDPYVKINSTERDELFAFYCEKIGAPADLNTLKKLRMAAAQRLMQALGAYFFLSQKMGKPHFRSHAKPALENLVGVSSELLPQLHDVAQKMLERERQNY